MPKFAVYSDLHLHNWEYGSHTTRNGYNSRLELQYGFLMQLGAYCKNNSIDTLFFCGDFFHTHGKISTDALFLANTALNFIAANGIKHYMLVGNHDISRNFKDRLPLIPNSLECFSNVAQILSNYRIGLPSEDLSYTVSIIPYVEDPKTFKNILSMVSKFKADKPHFLFMHQGVSGVPLGSGFLINETLSPDMIPCNVTRAFVGHYHTHKNLGKLVIVGPAMQHTKADALEEGGILVVDTETGSFERVKIYHNPKFVTVSAGFLTMIEKLTDASKQEIKKLVAKNFLRIVDVEDLTYEDLCGFKEKLLSKFNAEHVEFEFESKKIEKVKGDSNLSLEELISDFSAGLTERQISIGEELRKGNYEIPKI